jgi:hypothetical protein
MLEAVAVTLHNEIGQNAIGAFFESSALATHLERGDSPHAVAARVLATALSSITVDIAALIRKIDHGADR